MPVILEIAICVLLFVIVFIMPAFAIGALAKFALAPVLAYVDIVPGDNWYLGIVGGIALAMLLAWSFAVTAFLKRTGFFEKTNEARS